MPQKSSHDNILTVETLPKTPRGEPEKQLSLSHTQIRRKQRGEQVQNGNLVRNTRPKQLEPQRVLEPGTKRTPKSKRRADQAGPKTDKARPRETKYVQNPLTNPSVGTAHRGNIPAQKGNLALRTQLVEVGNEDSSNHKKTYSQSAYQNYQT